CLQHDNFYLTF
nr:immunoglobulin light chain junction region [Macaca mulatta]